MNLEQILARMAEIKVELEANAEGMDLEALKNELTELRSAKTEIETRATQRRELLDGIANERIPTTTVARMPQAQTTVERTFGVDSPEYRSAWLKTLRGGIELTDVEKRAYTHTTENTAAVIPTDVENKIYSTMAELHPILGDVNTLRSGTKLSIVKHTAIVAGDAQVVAETEGNDDEQNTFVEVALSGKKFSKHVRISYELAYMAIPAFEAYLVQEIAARLATARAADIITQIKADLAAANKVNAATPGSLVAGDLLGAFGLLKGVGRVVVYTNNASFYGDVAAMENTNQTVNFITNLQDNIAGNVLGRPVKIEDALGAGEILILDPQQYTDNVVAPITIERDRDIVNGVHVIAGHTVAGGTLTNDKAGVLITVGTGA